MIKKGQKLSNDKNTKLYQLKNKHVIKLLQNSLAISKFFRQETPTCSQFVANEIPIF